MERWYKVTAKIDDKRIIEWTCEGYLAVYRLLDEKFVFAGDSWDEVIEPEMECKLRCLKHRKLVMREHVTFRPLYYPCELTIEEISCPKIEIEETSRAKYNYVY